MTEYRWEFEEIGQGHYHTSFNNCFAEAHEQSASRSDLTILIEQFRPDRHTIGYIKHGRYYEKRKK